ncbi:hypothetical protein [Brevibacterium salitolerans]
MSTPGGSEPSRPRIRKAHSDHTAFSSPVTGSAGGGTGAGGAAGAGAGSASGTTGGADRPVTSHDGSPIHFSDPGGAGYWYDANAVLRYRGPDGAEYFLRNDQEYLPLHELTDADRQAAAAAGVPAAARQSLPPTFSVGRPVTGAQAAVGTAGAASAAEDRSTYYEYIAHHSGESPAVQAPLATGQAGAFPAAGAAGAGAAGFPPGGAGQNQAGEGGSRRKGLIWGFVGFGIVLVLAAVISLVVLNGQRGTKPTEIDPPVAQETEDSDGSAQPDEPSAEPSTPPPSPAEQLESYAEEGTRTAEGELAETWVVQLSAKKPGLEANGKTWSEEDILEEFEENKRRYPDAVLLWSGDWQSFKMGNFWITVLAEPYSDPEDALAECTNLGIDRDNCYAKKLSKVSGPEKTTRLND